MNKIDFELIKKNNAKVSEMIEKNNLYKEKLAELRKLQEDINSIGETMNVETLNDLNYNELKYINDNISTFFSLNNLKRFYSIFDNKKLETYPELNGAIYYPELNELIEKNIGDREHVKMLDNLLKKATKTHRAYKLTENSIYNIFRNSEKVKEIITFLESKELVDIEYRFECGCGGDFCTPTIVKNHKFKKHMFMWNTEKKYTDIYGTKEFFNVPEYEEYSVYESEGLGTVFVDCCEGEPYDITNLAEYKSSYKKIILDVVKAPDLSLDKI